MATSNAAAPGLRRVLGLWDLILLNIVAVTNLNLVPVVAAGGFPSLSLWVVGLLFFFLPQGVAVAEFATRYPEEGGIYVWTKKLYGDFHGFLSGWCYWTNNVFYIPTLLFYLVGISVYMAGSDAVGLGEDALFVSLLSLGLLWLFTGLNIRGLGVGKWVNNLGAVGAIVTTVGLVGVGLVVLGRQGVPSTVSPINLLPHITEWRTLSALSVICFGLVGLELGSVMGEEIKNPRRDIPRAALLGGVACAGLYLAASLTLLFALPLQEMSVIQGVLQAFQAMTASAGMGSLLPLLALLLTLSIAGATSAWLAGSARIPFVAGLDHYLPKILSQVHPRWHTPHAALLTHASLSSVFILMSFAGVGVREAYLTLLELAVIIQLIPFIYLYAGLMKVAGRPGGYYQSRAWLWVVGLVGLLTTLLATAVSFVPATAIRSVWWFEIKLLAGVGLFLGVGAGLFRWHASRKAAPVPAIGGREP